MGLIVRTEPIGVKYMEGYPQVRELLQQAGWLNFIENFDGFHKEITKSFSRSFDGTEVEIGDIKFIITESFLAEARNSRDMESDGSRTNNFIMSHGRIYLKI